MDENFNNIPTSEENSASNEPTYAQQPSYTASSQQPFYTEPAQQPAYQSPVSPKSRTVALILTIALGEYGAHLFYLDKPDLARPRLIKGIIASVLLCLTDIFIIGVIAAIAALILLIPLIIDQVKDIVAVSKGQMTDAQGLPVTKW